MAKIRDKGLSEADITLEQLLRYGRTLESTIQQSLVMSNSAPSVNAVSSRQQQHYGKTNKGAFVERGSSVGRMPDSQSREPGFESPLLPFRSLGIFFHFTTPQSTQLYK